MFKERMLYINNVDMSSLRAPWQICPYTKTRGPKGSFGRSPEKKVKGHSGAIYRGPLMLSTKYWKRTSRWCYTSNMKALGLLVSDKKIFENCFWKPNFLPCDLLMQPIITIWIILVGDHPALYELPVSHIRGCFEVNLLILMTSIYFCKGIIIKYYY